MCLWQECKELTPFEFSDDTVSGLHDDELEPSSSVECLEDAASSSVKGDVVEPADTDVSLAECDAASLQETTAAVVTSGQSCHK